MPAADTPSAAPTCCNVATTPAAMPAWRSCTRPSARLTSGVLTAPCAAPNQTSAGTSDHGASAAPADPTCSIRAAVAPPYSNAASMMARVPKRATSRGAAIEPATKPTLAGANTVPAVSASTPRPVCNSRA